MLELVAMQVGQAAEDACALARQSKLDLAPVVPRRVAHQQSLIHQPIDQADGAVVLDQQLLRKPADRALAGRWRRTHRQQGLVLLPGQADARSRNLAEVQEAAQGVAE